MAASCGRDPASMTVAAAEDLRLYLQALDRTRRPFVAPQRLALIEDWLESGEGEDNYA